MCTYLYELGTFLNWINFMLSRFASDDDFYGQTPKPMMSSTRKNARVTMHHTHLYNAILLYYVLRSTSEDSPIVSLRNALFCVCVRVRVCV